MNVVEISFITCVNDEEIYAECIKYIDNLIVPTGFKIKKIAIRNAKSMAAGYNEAMETNNCKYKVYLHQDTLIINRNFIIDFVNEFNDDSSIGMLGVIGTEKLLTDGVWWHGSKCFGKVYQSGSGMMKLDNHYSEELITRQVEAIDGLIMITQYDIRWKEDIFDGWHFYDISQCMEFYKLGYKVCIPKQITTWCIHACGIPKIDIQYESYRNKFLDSYSKDIFPLVSILIPPCDSKERLYASLERVVNQTYRNVEIIVMGEESDKEELKEVLNDNNLDFYLTKEQLTANENIDRVLFDSKGEYFYIANSNNLMKKNKIEKMMNNMIDSEIAVALNGFNFEDNIVLNNDNRPINRKKACNYIINNFDKLLENNVSAIINREFYINQYGCFKNHRFEYIANIATLTNCLMYGDLLYIKEKLDEDCNSNDVEWKNKLFSIQEMIVLSKYLRNKMIFKDTNEFDNFIGNIKKYYKRIVDNINCLNYDDKKNLIDCIDDSTKDLINKYDFNFKYIGDNVKILKDSNFIVSEGMIIEDNVSIFENATFMLPLQCGRIVVKKGCELGRRIFVSATNSIIIENDVIIASNVHITDHNHEYKKIGIPIMKQGVTSFTNEVVIGAGSWIANGCVIAGNVKIGRGCVIGANSVVLNDIPDYCVAAGSPAKVIKYFDRIKGEWVKVKNEEEYQEYINSLENVKPLLTIGIPTYNRSGYLGRCLDNIYNQIGNDRIIEVLVVDNASTDATDKVIQKYKNKYNNLTHIRREKTIEGNENVTSIYKLANGLFVNSHGDDDYYSDGIIYTIVEALYNNKDISLLFTLPKSCETNINIGYGINDYIKEVSYVSTLITGLIVKKSEIDAVINKKINEFAFNQVIFQLEIIKNNKKFAILKGYVFTGDSGEHKPYGYNLGDIFIATYLKLIESYRKYELTQDTFCREKLVLLNNMIIPWIYRIIKEKIDLDISNILDIYSEYYNEESYYEEKLHEIRQILS